MSIIINNLTEEQVQQLVFYEESHFLDLKAKEIKPSKLSRTISAFANANGGELFIGVEEHIISGHKIRRWNGFIDQEAANGHIQLIDQLFSYDQDASYEYLKSEKQEGLILHVTIQKSRHIICASDGTVYIRRNAQNIPINSLEGLQRLRLDKGLESFEDSTVDVDLSLITNSIPTLKFLIDVIPTAEPEAWLKKQQLIQNSKPTVAGLLLFAEEPQAILSKRSGVKIFRYATTDGEGERENLVFDPVTIEGHIYTQIRDTVNKTVEIVEGIPKMGKKGLEQISYPTISLHEIITNAVLHRDYSIPTDIQVRIFDNRIEVESPGRLPGHITRENILREQFARNGKLVRIINKFPDPPNKDVGEGLNTAFLAMSKLRLKPPTIDETETSVIVYIKHEALASPDAMVIEYLQEHELITNRTARQLTGVTNNATMLLVFNRLRDRGMIELVPETRRRSAAWRRVK